MNIFVLQMMENFGPDIILNLPPHHHLLDIKVNLGLYLIAAVLFIFVTVIPIFWKTKKLLEF